jgi:hypothetical protein
MVTNMRTWFWRFWLMMYPSVFLAASGLALASCAANSPDPDLGVTDGQDNAVGVTPQVSCNAVESSVEHDGVFAAGCSSGTGGGTTPTGTLTTNSPCSLPGPSAPTRCTVNVTWNTQHATYICLWASDTSLIDCEGVATWNTTYAWATTTPTTLELRSHPGWPTEDPNYPSNIPAVIAKSTLLAQTQVNAIGSTPPAGCTSAVPQGGSISAYLATLTAPATLCLLPGSTAFSLAQPLNVPSGITIKGYGQNSAVTIVQAAPTLVGPMFMLNGSSNVSISNLTLSSNGSEQSDVNATNVFVQSASNVTLTNLVLTNTYRMNVAITMSSNVTVSDSNFSQMGFAPQAQGAFWINNSIGVSVLYNTINGRNNGPGATAASTATDPTTSSSTTTPAPIPARAPFTRRTRVAPRAPTSASPTMWSSTATSGRSTCAA